MSPPAQAEALYQTSDIDPAWILSSTDSLTATSSLVATSIDLAPPVDLSSGEAVVSDALYLSVKRGLDIVLSAMALVVLSPLFLVVAIVTMLSDFGPAIFRQTRVGKNGKLFTCYKFRTMVTGAESAKLALLDQNEHSDSRTFKMKNDPRITRFGQILRKLSIDETLQLWNVLRGEMSLVGPRPPVPSEVAQYSASDLCRLDVKPGLTCIWQVSGRSNLPFPEQVRLDLEYIDNRSLALDFKLMLKTVPAVLSGKGAV